MYRDDQCAVCGEALPPDHLYCRMHAAEVDSRLHHISAGLEELHSDTTALVQLLRGIAPETWDYLAEAEDDDPEWPPPADVLLRVRPEQVDVDVDSEPGFVRIRLQVPLVEMLAGVADSLRSTIDSPFIHAAAQARGAGATH